MHVAFCNIKSNNWTFMTIIQKIPYSNCVCYCLTAYYSNIIEWVHICSLIMIGIKIIKSSKIILLLRLSKQSSLNNNKSRIISHICIIMITRENKNMFVAFTMSHNMSIILKKLSNKQRSTQIYSNWFGLLIIENAC